jgi:hypothetical protein
MVRSVRDRFDSALPVIRASSSSEPGAFSAMTAMDARFPNLGMGVALAIGSKVNKGEIKWG